MLYATISSLFISFMDFKILAHWWGSFGGATPNLKKIPMRILSLTSSSSGCERNWSTFEGVRILYLNYNYVSLYCIFLFYNTLLL